MPDYTQDHSIPYPLPTDPIRGSTSDYILTDLRDLATGADAAITTAVGTRAPVSHTHSQSDVTGLSGALDAAASTAEWGGVSNRPSAFPPAAHTHERLDLGGSVFKLNPAGGFEQHAGGSRRWLVDETGTLLEGSVPPARVTSLVNRLALLEYDSGFRNLTALIDGQGANPGALFAFRLGQLVTIRFEGITPPSSGNWSPATFPTGFRPRAVSGAASRGLLYQLDGSTMTPVRYDISTVGRMIVRSVTADIPIFGEITTVTTDTPPTTPPGDPA